MRRRGFAAQAEEAEVNIIPLLDIIFILLIFFIVTSTFLDERGIALMSPDDNQEQQRQTRPPPTLMLSVQNDGFVQVDNVRLIDPRSVAPVVEEFKAREPSGVVLVNAAPDSHADTTVTVLDQARQAGVEAALTISRE